MSEIMELNFCRRCGGQLTRQGEPYICSNGHTLFAGASTATGIFFLSEDNSEVMVSVRGIEPYKGQLDAFGGFVELNENAETALAREIEEELGLTPDQYETPRYLCSDVTDYPFDGEVRKVLGLLYWSRLKPGAIPVPADDVAEIRTLSLKDFDTSQMANGDTKVGIEKLKEIFHS